MFVQFQLVMIASVPSFRNRDKGSRLTKKASFTAVVTLVEDQSLFWGLGVRVVRMGYERRIKIRIRLEVIARGV